MKTDNPSAFATVNWKVCKSAIALYCLYLSVIKRSCNRSANKSNHPNRTRYFRHAYNTTRDNILHS
jgi:hypothetical protein